LSQSLFSLRSLSRNEILDIDRRAIEEVGVPGSVLMENAGRGTAGLMERIGIEGPVVIVAGHGNNGGDGFVVARHLDCHGYDVRVLLVANSSALPSEAAVNWRILTNSGVASQELGNAPGTAAIKSAVSKADWTVDGLLGTGAYGPIREPFASVIECLTKSAKRILAIDAPSGLDCETGKPLGPCIRAQHTATFVSRKHGFDAPGASRYTGEVHVIDIGVPRALLESYRIDREGKS
jgi:NAD(P)H-hydrate epimerase